MKTAESEKTILYIYEYSRFLLTFDFDRKCGRGTGIGKVVWRTHAINSATATTKDFKISQQSSCCLFATFCNFKRFGTLKIL